MNNRLVSVIVVSRGRADLLLRCLSSLAQLDYAPFEIVVIADPSGCKAVEASNFADQVKLVEFDVPNISAARNLGVCRASGQIVAFIDDDAVAEPLWLEKLIEPITSGRSIGAGGFVVGRNGISLQWAGRAIDALGQHVDVNLSDTEIVPFAKTEGTNMAFCRRVLLEQGGFDEQFQFFMDETDLNYRLAKAELPVAIVPKAQVHHGFAQSERRKANRVPTDLFHVGRSSVLFLRKAGNSRADIENQLTELRNEQSDRLASHVSGGRLSEAMATRVKKTLEAGIKAGLTETLKPVEPQDVRTPDPLVFPSTQGATRTVFVARWYNFSKRLAAARSARARGDIVTLYKFSLTTLYHRVTFTDDGIWLQAGGLFGRSVRATPVFQFWTKSRRVAHESARLDGIRHKGRE